jgi:hypothetical protein
MAGGSGSQGGTAPGVEDVDGEDVDARRFYETHGFSNTEPGAPEPMFYYYKDLD